MFSEYKLPLEFENRKQKFISSINKADMRISKIAVEFNKLHKDIEHMLFKFNQGNHVNLS